MAGFIGEDQVRRIKEAVDLVHLMGDYTTLKRAGNHHTGCCPFHQERTPSMYVYDDGHYHCFGCGAHGDVVTLVREKEHLDFTDAIEVLARRAGIEIHYEKGGRERMARSERDQLVEAMELATRFYERCLWDTAGGGAALTYLRGRGLSDAVIKRFRLGWAPGGGQLLEDLRRHRINPDLAAKLDLAVDRNGRWGDRFFERVSFPICDRFGQPIAFSCRLLPEAERRAKEEGRGVGKYVNSTDTPLYHKGSIVFNLHQARPAAKEKGRLIVMEGPTDVMAAADAGIAECVAVLGTALTPEHAKQLGSLAGNGGRLILMLDGDRAGQANAIKAIRTCLSVGVPTWIAVVPDEMDPGELLKEDANAAGAAGFERVVGAARADIDHLLRALAPRPYELEHRELLAVADEVIACLRPLSDRELVDLYLRDLARWLNVDRGRLDKRLAGGGDGPQARSEGPAVPELARELEVVLHLLVRRPDLRPLVFDQLGLEPMHVPTGWRPVVERLLLEPELSADGVALMGEDAEHAALAPLLRRWAVTDPANRTSDPVGAGDEEHVLRISIERVRLRQLEDDLHRIGIAIGDAERRRDFAAARQLMDEKRTVMQAIADLKAFS